MIRVKRRVGGRETHENENAGLDDLICRKNAGRYCIEMAQSLVLISAALANPNQAGLALRSDFGMNSNLDCAFPCPLLRPPG